MCKGIIGIYSDIKYITDELLLELSISDYYIFIISNVKRENKSIYYFTPEEFNTLKTKLSYLIIIDDLSYFLKWSFDSVKVFYWVKTDIINKILLNNIKKNIDLFIISEETQIVEENKVIYSNLNKILNENKSSYNINDYINVFEDYIFIPNGDYMGNDIFDVRNKSIYELKQIADNLEDCVCFNTWGYFKNKMEKYIILENRFNIIDGVYIKKTIL